MKSNDALKARAESVFKIIPTTPETSAMDKYRAKQAARLDNMSRLRALRLARDGAKQ
jgi:hypothetical protein